MFRVPTNPEGKPGWACQSDDDAVASQMTRRRWRILQCAKPRTEPPEPMPNWVRSPEDFIRWLETKLTAHQLLAYLRDLEGIAKATADLELLRFTRQYIPRDRAGRSVGKRGSP
jgi:hypothetical protein